MKRISLIPALLLCAGLARAADITVSKPPSTNKAPAAAVAEAPSYAPELTQNSLVGEYQQPEWTLHRRFPTTRVYLQKEPGEIGVEQWVRSKVNQGERTTHRVQEEVEIGLPHRLQLDLYVNSEINSAGTWYYDNFATELRYALADWGVIPMNPTLYGEYKIKDEGVDVAEAKLLLGGQWPGGWDWAFNFAYEWDLGGERTQEFAESAGISHAVIDRKLGLGIEARYTSESVEGSRGDPENSLNVGPSIQWRPTANTHLDVVPLFGCTEDAPDILSYVVFGYDFGAGDAKTVRNPASSRAE